MRNIRLLFYIILVKISSSFGKNFPQLRRKCTVLRKKGAAHSGSALKM